MALFQPGNPGKPKGAIAKATREVREIAQRLVEDEKYVASLTERLRRGTAPHMETLLFHYAYGKPKDVVEVQQTVPLFALPDGTRVDMAGIGASVGEAAVSAIAASITVPQTGEQQHVVVHQAQPVGDAGTDAGVGECAGPGDSGGTGA